MLTIANIAGVGAGALAGRQLVRGRRKRMLATVAGGAAGYLVASMAARAGYQPFGGASLHDVIAQRSTDQTESVAAPVGG